MRSFFGWASQTYTTGKVCFQSIGFEMDINDCYVGWILMISK
ncbi:hypothetical protein [Moraxella boevrei]